ncbi:Ras like protein family, member T1 [Trypanosoma theileri]|uniref:Ras like protein family, member T1 n=1 Tax=Trypanosoma theileri TaxID=67003 RepID=A0A1X0NPJ9_9TRYP|nr:Ras like protein family, member T1 [Trypanosoma theileri]ORC86642.1 Ras like protein family, member T1 [Trypanosoma theileri]
MVLATIHVLICGTDFHRVEGVLGGCVENTNYAWNRRYDISCTSAPRVDDVDSRLLSMCHLVVLTRGAVCPQSAKSFRNKPTVSIEGTPESVLSMVKECDFYYGMHTIASLRSAVVDIGLSPPHVIWEKTLKTFTQTGDLALRRAFWLLDKDDDGMLNEEELIAWQRSITSASFSKNDLIELFNNGTSHSGYISIDYELFLNMQKTYLLEGDVRRVWATLHVTGVHPDGLPYSWRDIHAIRVSKESNTYLSHIAIQFFRNLYKLRRFHELDDIWSVTPGCPWKHINGFLTKRIPLDKFIEYWKYMGLVKRDVVVQYARYWGYKGDTSPLFLLRHARPFREMGEVVPNTIQVLVVGSPGCGRRSLMFTLTAKDEEFYEDEGPASNIYVRTTTFFVRNGNEEVPQTVVYVAVPLEEVSRIMENETLSKQVDVVLLCYDGTQVEETSLPIMRVYLEAKSSLLHSSNLPFVVVMTKAEATVETEKNAEANKILEDFCRQQQLLWPPVVTSVEDPEESEIVALNEYMHAIAKEPEIAIANPPLTPTRILRRVVIVTTFAVALGAFTRFLLRRLRKKSN